MDKILTATPHSISKAERLIDPIPSGLRGSDAKLRVKHHMVARVRSFQKDPAACEGADAMTSTDHPEL
jgi:hypothetical protein